MSKRERKGPMSTTMWALAKRGRLDRFAYMEKGWIARPYGWKWVEVRVIEIVPKAKKAAKRKGKR